MKIIIQGPIREGSCDDLVVDGALLENLVRRAMQSIEKGLGTSAKVTVVLEPDA